MVNRYNNIMQTLLFMVLATSGITQIVSTVTIVLSKSSEVPVYLIGFLLKTSIQATVVILVAYGFAGDFNQESSKSLERLNRENRNRICLVQRQEFLYTKKFLASCQVQRVQFDLSNFIEKTTPLVFQLYCINRIIDLLLVK